MKLMKEWLKSALYTILGMLVVAAAVGLVVLIATFAPVAIPILIFILIVTVVTLIRAL